MGVSSVQLAFHAKQAGLHKDADFVGQKGFATGAEIVILPEGSDGPKLFFGFLGDVEHVAVALLEQIQLIHDEFQGIFGENGSIAVLGSLISCEKGFIFNIDGHMLQNLLQHQGTHHDPGLVQAFTVSLRGPDGTLGVHIGFLIQNFFAKSLHAFG